MKKIQNIQAFLFLAVTTFLLVQINCQTEQYFYERIHTVKLEGSTGETVYWVNLYVGSPPQRQTAIIDTGSYLLAFPCSGCQSCGDHIDFPYDLSKSMTSKKEDCQNTNISCQGYCGGQNDCKWSVSYAEGSSISGYMAGDYIVLGDEMQNYIEKVQNQQITDKEEEDYLTYLKHESVYLNFGCTTNETNLFLTQVPDGIIGLAPSDKSGRRNIPNIVDEIFKNHKTNGETHVFSLCLNSEQGGFMSVGGYNYELHEDGADTKIIPFDSSSGFYSVDISKIMIGDNEIVSSPGYTIIDSGTTIVMGPSRIINPIIREINRLCETQYTCGGQKNPNDEKQRKFLYKPENFDNNIDKFFATFPTIEFKFKNGVIIEWEPSAYMFVDPSNGVKNLYQFGFEPYDAGKLYLGGPFMKNYDILFDRDNNQIHFTRSQCTMKGVTSMNMNLNSHKILKSIEDGSFVKDIQQFRQKNKINQKEYNKQEIELNENSSEYDYSGINGHLQKLNNALQSITWVKAVSIILIVSGAISLTISLYYLYKLLKQNDKIPPHIELEEQDSNQNNNVNGNDNNQNKFQKIEMQIQESDHNVFNKKDIETNQ